MFHSLYTVRGSLTQSLNHSITQSLNHSITQSLNHSITQSLNHSITQSLNHSITQSPNHLITHSPRVKRFIMKNDLIQQIKCAGILLNHATISCDCSLIFHLDICYSSSARVLINTNISLNLPFRSTRPDQTRPDQTRPDQTRPDQTRPAQIRLD